MMPQELVGMSRKEERGTGTSFSLSFPIPLLYLLAFTPFLVYVRRLSPTKSSQFASLLFDSLSRHNRRCCFALKVTKKRNPFVFPLPRIGMVNSGPAPKGVVGGGGPLEKGDSQSHMLLFDALQ